MDKTEKTTANSHAFKINIRAWKHIHSLNPSLLPLTVLKSIFGQLAPFINLYMPAEIMNELAGNSNMNKLIFFSNNYYMF